MSCIRFIYILLLFMAKSVAFIIGPCIGPKSVLEMYLNENDKKELRRLVHESFDGSNVDEVLAKTNHFVFEHVTDDEWRAIVPKLSKYQQARRECSLYAQLLPKPIYQQLLRSVFRAGEMGANKFDVKRLVDDYVERLSKHGILPDVVRYKPKSFKRKNKNRLRYSKKVHPTLIEEQIVTRRREPLFPIVQPGDWMTPYNSGLLY